jgi:hypothetical protein
LQVGMPGQVVVLHVGVPGQVCVIQVWNVPQVASPVAAHETTPQVAIPWQEISPAQVCTPKHVGPSAEHDGLPEQVTSPKQLVVPRQVEVPVQVC